MVGEVRLELTQAEAAGFTVRLALSNSDAPPQGANTEQGMVGEEGIEPPQSKDA